MHGIAHKAEALVPTDLNNAGIRKNPFLFGAESGTTRCSL